jgi:hypothetical protein
MRKDPSTPLKAPPRRTAAIVILSLALVFLCIALAVGVLRLIAQQPDLTARTWPEQAGLQQPDR